MHNAFKLSLFGFLLLIPQHGNSPIPRMESWMEMDQGDGFVDRDLTSSLTGAESFGSAHKNYQNALIRKKQTENEDEAGNIVSMDMFYGGMSGPMQRRSPIPVAVNQYSNYPYSKYENSQSQPAYDLQGYSMNGYQSDRFRMPMANKNAKMSSLYRNQRYNGLIAMRSNDNELFMPKADGLAKCTLCQNQRSSAFDPEETMMGLMNIPENNENSYSTENEESLSRVKSEMNENDFKDMQFEGEDQMTRYGRDEEEDLGLDDSDYYNDGLIPARGDAMEMDYSQINPHNMLYKREEKAEKSKSNGNENKLKSDNYKSEIILPAVAPKDGREIAKPDSKSPVVAKSDTLWNSNLNGDDLLRESQRALEEVQLYQQKLANKPQFSYNMDWKTENYARGQKRNLGDGRRNKREDEDEQKNMKTGSDEGGGEYEDEEGKGHNDEEEYYEEAEFCGQPGPACENHSCKREANQDTERKSKKTPNNDVSSKDFVLTLDNAPVEHDDKSKNYVLREGPKERKKIWRNGTKIWDEWGKWSPCSVTCGVGRMTRWRHCIGGGCAKGEKEALIKKCTYPAC